MSTNHSVVVRLRPGSDGDATHTPPPGVYTLVNPPTLYLEKTAIQWMEKRGEAQAGVRYILESLPTGYTMWQRPRPSNPKHVDKYLFGHPNHKPFDSPNRFFPHFQYLMDNSGNSIGCPCTVCAGAGGVLPAKKSSSNGRIGNASTASSRPSTPNVPSESQCPPVLPAMAAATQFKGRPKVVSTGLDTAHVDEEGTPDVYQNLINKLQRDVVLDEAITEPLSPDWRAEQQILPALLKAMLENEQWIPRPGEIVLYLRDLPGGVDFVRHESTGELKLYDEQTGQLSTPAWEAGLVAQVPTTTPTPTTADLFEDIDPADNVIYAGFRVEPLPNPNDHDKSLSKRHKYIGVRQARPFVLWQDLLRDIQEEDWHPTISHALTVMSTLSLLGKHHFIGKWPDASIYCHGIYLGAELLTVGDTVRLLPSSRSGQTTCSEIMVIRSIRLKWTGMDKAYKSEIWVYGSAYTSDASCSNKKQISYESTITPKAAAAYASWYPLHPPNKELAVPYSRIFGRLMERDALAFFLTSSANDLPDLDAGRVSLLAARTYALTHDQRITATPNAKWYWGDSRAEALDIHTINGFDIAKYDPNRDMKDARKKLRIIDSIANGSATTMVTTQNDLFSAEHGLRRFMAPCLPLPTTTDESRASSRTLSDTSSTPQRGKKRAPAVDIEGPPHQHHTENDDDDDDSEDEDENERDINALHQQLFADSGDEEAEDELSHGSIDVYRQHTRVIPSSSTSSSSASAGRSSKLQREREKEKTTQRKKPRVMVLIDN
ncbi:hypothetical protein ACN47E_002280 [Coniothyrium glycines]